MLASLATIMKEKTALVTSMVYFALTPSISIGGGNSTTPSFEALTESHRLS